VPDPASVEWGFTWRKAPGRGILTGYTYRGTTPAFSLPAIRADGPGKRLKT